MPRSSWFLPLPHTYEPFKTATRCTVVLVWALFNWLTRKSSATVPASTPSSQSALEILQQRYARGEIDTATFEGMREQLDALPHSQFEKQTTAGGS